MNFIIFFQLSLWSSPSLAELNVSHNNIHELPVFSDGINTSTISHIPDMTQSYIQEEGIKHMAIGAEKVFNKQGVHHHNHWGEKLNVSK